MSNGEQNIKRSLDKLQHGQSRKHTHILRKQYQTAQVKIVKHHVVIFVIGCKGILDNY